MVSYINRIADVALNRTAMADTAATSQKIEEARRQVYSGKSMTSFQEASDHTLRILNLETSISGMVDFEPGETTINVRLQKMELVVRQLNSIASDYSARLTNAVSFGPTDPGFQDYCQKKLTEVESLLNSTDTDGRYLFAGEATTTPPVNVSLLPTPNLGDPVNYSYYCGHGNPPAGLIGDDQPFTYGVTANDDGFANLIHALKIGATTLPNNDASSVEYQKLQNNAMTVMGTATKIIPDCLQQIGTSMKVVEGSMERQKAIIDYEKGLLSELTDADYFVALADLNRLTVALQCSYIATQKMNSSLEDMLSALRNSR
jgi:flagellar hook-associated protein 3 FlgL